MAFLLAKPTPHNVNHDKTASPEAIRETFMNKWVIAAVVLFAAVNGAVAAGSQSGPLQKEKETGQPVVPGTKGDERAIGTTPDRLERLERHGLRTILPAARAPERRPEWNG
jgi:hypothetical protein